MSLKNRSMYSILGILSISPATGYDIKKYSDTVLSGFWNENFGHIYPTLKKLSDEGMIETVSGRKEDRKITYCITEKGRQELETWLSEETLPQPVRSEFMLKLLFSSSQPKDTIEKKISEYRKRYEKSLERYRRMESELKDGIADVSEERALYLKVVLRRGILSDEAVLRWCDETCIVYCTEADSDKNFRLKSLDKCRKKLVSEINAMGIRDLHLSDLNTLSGSYVNLEYTLPNGQKVKMLDDNDVYLGNQIEIQGSERCYGIVADDS